MNRVRRHQRGYIFRKGASWFLRYYDLEVGSSGAATLVQRCRKLADYSGAYRSKKAVKTLADEFLAPYNNGTFTAQSTISVVDFWKERYLPHIEEQKRPSTVNGYKKMWNTYLQQRMSMPIRDFGTDDCERLLKSIVLQHDVNKTTLKHVKHLLSGVFRFAIRQGAIRGANPIREACIPSDARCGTETHAYKLTEILGMLEVLPQPAKAMIAIAAFAGLRKGELRSIRPEDYDGKSLRVQRTAWRHHLNPPKGKRGTGTIPLIQSAAMILDEHLASAKPKKYIFETSDGKPGSLEYVVREVIRPTLNSAGLPWHGLHAFRRGLATNLHDLGVADIVIQSILRHSDVSVTRQAYIKNDATDVRGVAAMQVLEQAVCNEYATTSSHN